MDYELLSILLFGWIICFFYLLQAFEDFKNWKKIDHYLKFLLLNATLGFIAFSFLLTLFFLNEAGIIGH